MKKEFRGALARWYRPHMVLLDFDPRQSCYHNNTFWVLQLAFTIHISQKGHMQLVTSELLNPCHFTHLMVEDVELQSPVVLMTKILIFFYNSEIPCHH
jgi:hypothetical protein